MTDRAYILDGKNPVQVDYMTWAKGFGSVDRHVAVT